MTIWSSNPRPPWWLRGKESTCNADDTGDMVWFLGGANGNPLQYSRLENPTEERGVQSTGLWRAGPDWETEPNTSNPTPGHTSGGWKLAGKDACTPMSQQHREPRHHSHLNVPDREVDKGVVYKTPSWLPLSREKGWTNSICSNKDVKSVMWRGRWEGGLGWGIHVNPWLIHVNVCKNHYNTVK